MTDTYFADISEYQVAANDSYPFQVLSFRANDGTYRDHHFSQNLAWAKSAVARNRLVGFLVYCVWEPNWLDTVNTLKSMVGTPHPNMAVMIDVESWSGKIRGDQSAGINATRENLIKWLGNRSRVIGYGNVGDLRSLWPNRSDAQLVVAAYGSNPSFPGKIAQQYSDRQVTIPFGPCDINVASGLSPAQFAEKLGLAIPSPPVPVSKDIVDMDAAAVQRLLTAQSYDINMHVIAYAGPRYVRFPNAKNGSAIYAWDGAYLTWVTAQDWKAIGSLHLIDIADHLHSNIYRCPITPGTPDPRK